MKIFVLYSKWISHRQWDLLSKFFDEKDENIKFRVIPDKPKDVNFKEAKEVFEYNSKLLKNSDVIVAECSYVSSEIGYHTALALESKKPVIALYNMTENISDTRHIRNIQVGLKGNDSKYLFLKQYELNNFNNILERALEDASKMLFSKFNFTISSEINSYLDWYSKTKKITKSDFARKVFDDLREKDGEYKKYLEMNKL